MTQTTTVETRVYTPIVDAILAARPDLKIPEGMVAGLKFTSPTQTTHGGYQWPNPGEWAGIPEPEWDPRLCFPGGFHAATTIAAAQSGGQRYTHAMIVAWYPDEASTSTTEPGKVKARRILSIARIDLLTMLRNGNVSGADLSGAYLIGTDLTGATASSSTMWPKGFDATEAGVLS